MVQDLSPVATGTLADNHGLVHKAKNQWALHSQLDLEMQPVLSSIVVTTDVNTDAVANNMTMGYQITKFTMSLLDAQYQWAHMTASESHHTTTTTNDPTGITRCQHLGQLDGSLYQCTICDRRFGSLEALERYRRITARHEWCERCKRVFKDMEARLYPSPLDFECCTRQWDKIVTRWYQRSLRHTGHTTFQSDYFSLFDQFSNLSSMPYRCL
jgi:hypothetical protein